MLCSCWEQMLQIRAAQPPQLCLLTLRKSLSLVAYFICKTVVEGLGYSSVVEYCLNMQGPGFISWNITVGSLQCLIKFSTQNTLKIASYRVNRETQVCSLIYPLIECMKKHLLNTNYAPDSALSAGLTGQRQQIKISISVEHSCKQVVKQWGKKIK